MHTFHIMNDVYLTAHCSSTPLSKLQIEQQVRHFRHTNVMYTRNCVICLFKRQALTVAHFERKQVSIFKRILVAFARPWTSAHRFISLNQSQVSRSHWFSSYDVHRTKYGNCAILKVWTFDWRKTTTDVDNERLIESQILNKMSCASILLEP